MRVLVTGANGYIGNAVAIELRRRGHIVYGLIRSSSNAKLLQQQEIIPVVGSMNTEEDINAWLKNDLTTVHAVIDTVTPDFASSDYDNHHRSLLRVLQKLPARQPSQTIHYVLVSGVLVYGDHSDKHMSLVDESDELRHPALKPRVPFEQHVVNLGRDTATTAASSTSSSSSSSPFNNIRLIGTVIRPVWVYGLSNGRFLSSFFTGNAQDEIVIRGKPDKRQAWVHVSDCANALALAIEKPSQSAGEVFDIADSTRSTYEETTIALSRAAGVKGKVVYEAVDPSNPFMVMSEVSVVPRADKIRRLLGWEPTRVSVLDEANIIALSGGHVKPQA